MSIRIAVTGLPFFGQRVAATLRREGFEARYVPEARAALRRPRRLAHLLRAQVVYAIGPSIERRGPLDLVSRLGKRIVVHWVGTDVEYGIRAMEQGSASARLVQQAVHWADAPWLAAELADAGIDAEVRPLPMPIAIGEETPMPDEHRVLIYLPKQPGSAHDVAGTLRVVAALPELAFTVVGGYVPEGRLANLRNEGYVTDMASQYREHSILLRLTHHDGLSHSVIEALSFGRHVVWTHAMDGVHRVSDADEAVAMLRTLTEARPSLNTAGLAAAAEFETNKIVGPVSEALRGMAN